MHKVKKRDKMEDSSVSKERVEQNDGVQTSLTAGFCSRLVRSLSVMGGIENPFIRLSLSRVCSCC